MRICNVLQSVVSVRARTRTRKAARHILAFDACSCDCLSIAFCLFKMQHTRPLKNWETCNTDKISYLRYCWVLNIPSRQAHSSRSNTWTLRRMTLFEPWPGTRSVFLREKANWRRSWGLEWCSREERCKLCRFVFGCNLSGDHKVRMHNKDNLYNTRLRNWLTLV